MLNAITERIRTALGNRQRERVTTIDAPIAVTSRNPHATAPVIDVGDSVVQLQAPTAGGPIYFKSSRLISFQRHLRRTHPNTDGNGLKPKKPRWDTHPDEDNFEGITASKRPPTTTSNHRCLRCDETVATTRDKGLYLLQKQRHTADGETTRAVGIHYHCIRVVEEMLPSMEKLYEDGHVRLGDVL